MVPWMSGLVNGLQNRLRRFESARHLIKSEKMNFFSLFFYATIRPKKDVSEKSDTSQMLWYEINFDRF